MTLFEYRATVHRIVDGDTFDLDVDLGFGVMMRQRVRLARVDTWEVRGEERPLGLKAKERVEELMPPGTKVTMRTLKDKGKYGRYLAEIILASYENLGDLLLNEGHATLYGT